MIKSDRRRIPSLDGLRALSIIFVLLGHTQSTPGFPWSNWRFGFLAESGVRIFFVISGYLITSLLLKEEAQTGRISLTSFYGRRMWRIFPVFYAYLALLLVATGLRITAPPRTDLLFAFAYISNFRPHQFYLLGHLWSLSVEEQFYLVWPAVVVFGGPRLRKIALFGVIGFAPLFRFIALHFTALSPYVDQSTFTIADVIAFGCLLALYQKKLHQNAFYVRLLQPKFLCVAIIGCGIIIETVKFHSPYWFVQSVLDLLIAYLVDGCIVLAPAVLNNRFATGLGVRSYSIYVWQQVFCSVPDNWWNHFPLNVVLSIIVAALSYRYLEQPLIAYGRRRQKKRAGTDHDPAVALIPEPFPDAG